MSTKEHQTQRKSNAKTMEARGRHVSELPNMALDGAAYDGQGYAPRPIMSSNDISWVTKQIAIGSCIRDAAKMAEASRQGITHILNLSRFDNTKLAKLHGIRIL